MSWSDDIRCLYCDGKLPLYRKITSGQFCSSAHRKAYWQEQERLAVERLHQTHDSIRAYRPTTPIENILGPTEAAKAELSGFASTQLVPYRDQCPGIIVADPLAYEVEPRPGRPAASIADSRGRRIPYAGFVSDLRILEARLGSHGTWMCEGIPAEVSIALCQPATRFESCTAIPLAQRLAIPKISAVAFASFTAGVVLDPMPPRASDPAAGLCLNLKPLASSVSNVLQNVSEEEIPQADQLLALPRIQGRAALRAVPADAAEFCVAETFAASPALPAAHPAAPLQTRPLPQAGLRRIRLERSKLAQSLPAKSASGTPVIPAASAPAVQMTVPAALPQLGMASRVRHTVPSGQNAIRLAPAAQTELVSPAADLALPERSIAMAPAALAETLSGLRRLKVKLKLVKSVARLLNSTESVSPTGDVALPERSIAVTQPALSETPGALQRLKVKLELRKSVAKPFISTLAGITQPMLSEPARPVLKLEPLDEKPASDFLQPAAAPRNAVLAMAANAHLWTHAVDFWNRAPRDLKMLAFAIPALLALAFHPGVPKVHVTAPTRTSEIGRDVKTAVGGQWATVRQAVFDRAAVALDEDFRSGLDEWASRGDATAEWSFDATGFVRPSALALYRPSLGLTDYEMQFMGMIDKKALSWVVRASDFDNYYVVKLTVLKPGPITTLGVTRYAVIDGKAQDRADTVVPIVARPDMLYRVRMDVHEESFALTIQGQMIDSWSEPRLRHGGIGFFSARGEESRVRWVQVTHQYDMLGRLCAYLAPYDIPTTNGSW